LPPFADLCRTLRQPAQNLAVFHFRPLPGFAALCRPLLHPKGKKRATSTTASQAGPAGAADLGLAINSFSSIAHLFDSSPLPLTGNKVDLSEIGF
jgi:hypothetical protein